MKNLNEYKKNVNILYIEDDQSTSKKLQSILSKFFNKIYTASNGTEEYEIMNTIHDKISLIISDINMPKMDGIEFLEKIRSENNTIPFIFVTARSEPDKMLKAIQLDIDNYILKPIDLDNLLEVIDNVLKKEFNYYLKVKEHNIINLGNNLYWDVNKKTLLENEKELKLTKKELLLINLLIKDPSKIFTIDEIINEIWQETYDDRDYIANLKNLISRLKKKYINLNINNIYGLGYKISINK
jgi:DNA-binding response OmpR family regulator